MEVARKDRLAVHQKLKEFYEKLRSDGLAPRTRSLAYSTVRSFLNWNDLPLGKAPRHFGGTPRYEQHRMLENHEVSLMIHVARKTRDKPLISFLAQSGQRVGILTALRYRHVRSELESGVCPVVVGVTGELLNAENANVNKGRVVYRFAIGKECCRLLRMMMDERQRKGEQSTTIPGS